MSTVLHLQGGGTKVEEVDEFQCDFARKWLSPDGQTISAEIGWSLPRPPRISQAGTVLKKLATGGPELNWKARTAEVGIRATEVACVGSVVDDLGFGSFPTETAAFAAGGIAMAEGLLHLAKWRSRKLAARKRQIETS